MKRELTRMDKVALVTSFGVCILFQCDAVQVVYGKSRPTTNGGALLLLCGVVCVCVWCVTGACCGGLIVKTRQKAIHCIQHI